MGPEYKWFTTAEISYASAMYYLVFNTLFIVGICYCLVGCVTYPYSNKQFSKSHMRQTNKRFGSEFIKCTERVSRVVQDMIETQGTANTSAILMAPMESTENVGANVDALSNSTASINPTIQLNNKEIYSRVSSNIELIGLYTQINERILNEERVTQGNLFRRVTTNLQEIKAVLDRIEVRVCFGHPWFPAAKFISFWGFYNKVNSLTEVPTEAQNTKKFFQRLLIPIVAQNDSN